MSTTTNSLTLTMAYTGTAFTRKYKFDGIATADLAEVKTKVLAYNSNLPAADKKIFISDDYDATQGIGELASISAATYETVEYTRINLN